MSSPKQSPGVELKGIPESDERVSTLSQPIVEGSLKDFTGNRAIIGQELANTLGTEVGDTKLLVA